jgi:predicted nucleic acid-binding protein
LKYVLGADVLIGALDGSDAHHEHSRQLFQSWHEHDDALLLSVVNLSEVLVAPAGDRQRLRTAREAIAALGITVHAPNEALGVEAARLRSRYPISLPDGYLLATAKSTRATAVSFDGKILRAAKTERIPTLSDRPTGSTTRDRDDYS